MAQLDAETKAALDKYLADQAKKSDRGAGRLMMDFGSGVQEEVTQYMGMRHPSTQPLRMQADPYCVLKDGEAQRKKWPFRRTESTRHLPEVPEFCWRKRDDRNTVSLVHQGRLIPVLDDEIDKNSRDAVFDTTQIASPTGFKRQVMMDGLCLYRMTPELAGEWYKAPVDAYKGDLVRMAYTQSDLIRKGGYEPINQNINDETGTNFSVKNTQVEDPLNDL